MKRITFIVSMFAASVCLSTTVSAQERKFCGQATELEKMRIENPKDYQLYLEKAEELENHTRGFVEQKTNGRGDVYIVPIVFHIIHDYGLENISDDQVRDAVRIINEDFRKLNADTSDIVAAFKAIAGDSEIEFRLAQKDPFGNCTNGIIRVASKETYKGETPSTSNVSRWPRANYLNVWVVKQISSGAAGYTNYPSVFHNSPSIDGIMILNSYVGSIGTGDYTSSRALTHEIGHWINLAHTWGNSNNPEIPNNCNGDDGVTDTPNTIGWTSCNLAGNTCSSLDNVQNYMDYSYCDRMFTQGQSTRMRAALESSIAQRSNLWQPSNLALTGTTGTNDLCVADFNASQTEVCVGETVQLYDASYNNPTSWNWTFTGAAFVSSPTVSNPTVVYNTPGQYNVQLQVSDGVSSQSTVKSGYITVLPSTGIPVSIQESFESVSSVPGSEWFVFNPGDVNTWEIANVGATGSKSISIKNRTNPAAALNEISSTTIDLSSLSTSAKLSFKVAFAQKTLSNNDELRLFASYNCGKIWVSRWNRSGQNLATTSPRSSEYVPSDSTEWIEYLITLPGSYLNSDFRFKFQFKSDGGNNVYIDDINIYDPATVGIEEQYDSVHDFVVYPNPFKDEAVIELYLDKNETVKLAVVDILGKETVIYQESNLPQGEHSIRLSKSEMNLSKGIYFIKLTLGNSVSVKKVILN